MKKLKIRKLIILVALMILIILILMTLPLVRIYSTKNHYEIYKEYILYDPISAEYSDGAYPENFDDTEVIDIPVEILVDGVDSTNIVYFPVLDLVSFGVFSNYYDDIIFNYNVDIVSKNTDKYRLSSVVGDNYLYKQFEKLFIQDITIEDLEDIEKIVITEHRL